MMKKMIISGILGVTLLAGWFDYKYESKMARRAEHDRLAQEADRKNKPVHRDLPATEDSFRFLMNYGDPVTIGRFVVQHPEMRFYGKYSDKYLSIITGGGSQVPCNSSGYKRNLRMGPSYEKFFVLHEMNPGLAKDVLDEYLDRCTMPPGTPDDRRFERYVDNGVKKALEGKLEITGSSSFLK